MISIGILLLYAYELTLILAFALFSKIIRMTSSRSKEKLQYVIYMGKYIPYLLYIFFKFLA